MSDQSRFSGTLCARDLEALGGLDPRIRKLLGAREKGLSARHVKVSSIIVREYQGKLHEVLVVSNLRSVQ
jgi:hypothetical protein